MNYSINRNIIKLGEMLDVKLELFKSGLWDELAWISDCKASRVIGSRLRMSQEFC